MWSSSPISVGTHHAEDVSLFKALACNTNDDFFMQDGIKFMDLISFRVKHTFRIHNWSIWTLQFDLLNQCNVKNRDMCVENLRNRQNVTLQGCIARCMLMPALKLARLVLIFVRSFSLQILKPSKNSTSKLKQKRIEHLLQSQPQVALQKELKREVEHICGLVCYVCCDIATEQSMSPRLLFCWLVS